MIVRDRTRLKVVSMAKKTAACQRNWQAAVSFLSREDHAG